MNFFSNSKNKSLTFCIIGLILTSYYSIDLFVSSVNFLLRGLLNDESLAEILINLIAPTVFNLTYAVLFVLILLSVVDVIKQDKFLVQYKRFSMSMLILGFVIFFSSVTLNGIHVEIISYLLTPLFMALTLACIIMSRFRFFFKPLFVITLAFNMVWLINIILLGFSYGFEFVDFKTYFFSLVYIMAWISFYYANSWVLLKKNS